MSLDAQAAPQRPAHVFVGFAEALSAVEVVRSLLDAGHRVTLWTRAGNTPASARLGGVGLRPLPAPETGVAASLAALRVAALELAPDVVLPIDDDALWLAARAWPDGDGPLTVPDAERAAFALDKRRQTRAARAAGLRVPETVEVETRDAAARLTGFPLLVRPALAARESAGCLGRGRVAICADGQELDAALREWNGTEPLLAQPYVTGRGEGVFGCMRDGVLHAASAHRRVRMMNPHGSGASACAPVALDDDLGRSVEALGRSVGWAGMFMVELIRDSADRTWFIEWNGRAWGSMALARSRGLEYPAWTVDAALGRAVDYVEPVGDERFLCRHAGREILHLLHVLRGPRSQAVQGWPSRWRTLVDVLHWRRSDRWYNLQASGWRLFLSETLHTVGAKLHRGGSR